MKLTRENRSTQGKTCTSATLSNTNPTWNNPGLNPGLRDWRPATNRLSHGTAQKFEFNCRSIAVHAATEQAPKSLPFISYA
jgi:hypothetical protein